jgi:hypothetical protein
MDIFTEAPNLLRRYREGAAFRRYVDDRSMLVLPAVLVFVAFSVITTATTIVFFGTKNLLLMFVVMAMAPFILGASLVVFLFVFFSWLEARSMAQLSGRPAPARGSKAAISLLELRSVRAQLPPIPWLFAGIFVGVPLIIASLVSPNIAAGLIGAVLGTPILYALFDR